MRPGQAAAVWVGRLTGESTPINERNKQMSEFYGRIQGNRGEATRGGTKASGISATAETWHSVIRAEQHMSSASASGHEATVSVSGKHGGSALTLRFDADTLYETSDNPDVQVALQAVRDAMRNADDVAQCVAKQRKTERILREAGV
jgi:hypothetical protein